MADTRTLDVTIRQAVMHIRFSRPERLNAMNEEMVEELTRQILAANVDPSVRVLVLSGAGDGFCAGWDRGARSQQGDAHDVLSIDAAGGALMAALDDLTKPTIAQLHGCVVGGGLVLATSCDFRLASTDSYYWLPEVIYGSPVFMTGLAPMVREIGFAATRYLAVGGLKMSSDWALRHGMVQDVVSAAQLANEVDSLANRLAEYPDSGIRLMKRELRELGGTLYRARPAYRAVEVLDSFRSPTFQASMAAATREGNRA